MTDDPRQIDRDCEFLEAEGIMDYSLLVGLHFCDDICSSSKTSLSACSSSPCELPWPHHLLSGVKNSRENHYSESPNFISIPGISDSVNGSEDADWVLDGRYSLPLESDPPSNHEIGIS